MAQGEIEEGAGTIPADRFIVGIETDPMLCLGCCGRGVPDSNGSRSEGFKMNALEFYSPLCKVFVNLLHESARTAEKEIAVRTRHQVLDCLYADSSLSII